MWVYQVYRGHGLLAQPRSSHFFTYYLMVFPLDARSAGLVSESRLAISGESFLTQLSRISTTAFKFRWFTEVTERQKALVAGVDSN
jgi:hypothetical protein